MKGNGEFSLWHIQRTSTNGKLTQLFDRVEYFIASEICIARFDERSI
jgi:hypothetical protein